MIIYLSKMILTAVFEDNLIHLLEGISYFQKSLSKFVLLASGDSMK